MKSFRIGKTHINWQFYPSLGLSKTKLFDEDFRIHLHFLIIGPFQFEWWGK